MAWYGVCTVPVWCGMCVVRCLCDMVCGMLCVWYCMLYSVCGEHVVVCVVCTSGVYVVWYLVYCVVCVVLVLCWGAMCGVVCMCRCGLQHRSCIQKEMGSSSSSALGIPT